LAEGTTPLERAATCDIARFLYLTGDYRTAHDILQIAGTSSVSSYKILIDVLLALGRHQGAYDLAKGNRGTSPGVSAEDRLCTCTRALGHFHEARRLRLQMREAPIQPADLHELAHDHSLVGDHAMARELFQRAYMERSAGPGFSPVDVLESWNGLAREARLCGSYREAIDLGEEAYGYGIRELTVEHHQTLLTAKDLAIAYRRNGELDAALELGRHTEDRLRRLLGSDHPDTLAATMCVSNTLRADAVRSEPREGRSVDHLAEALMLAEAATGRYASVLGPEHPYTHACRVDLALLHHLLGDPETALAIGTSARVGLIASLDEEHEYVLICDLNLRSDLAALGRNEEAARVGTTVRDRLAERPVWYPHLALAYALGEEVGDEERAEITETLRAKHPEVLTAHEGVRIDCDLDPPPL
ncbi:tetratricopeptide repeat protein, partial [Nonomuraea fuscirosea]|uniref:tetratricopeptide repeat protein n=1 Tax=Nonomuraea fuscirosea TaxID=1291556 RepID=UPI003423C8DB